MRARRIFSLKKKSLTITRYYMVILALSGCVQAIHPLQTSARFGFTNEGRLFQSSVPIFSAQLDQDQDGIYDTWEIAVARLVNPDIALDEEEDLLQHDDHHVINFVRVRPLGEQYILFTYLITWSMDYGRLCSKANIFLCYSHAGDVERVLMAWQVIDDYTIELKYVFTSAHYGSDSDHSGVWPATGRACNHGKVDGRLGKHDYTHRFCSPGVIYENNRLRLYASEDKHAIYPRAQTCEDATLISLPWLPDIAEDCGGGEVRQFPAYNVGEPEHPFLDRLSEHTELASVFPGEAIWHDADGKFCGGACPICSGDCGEVPNYIGRRFDEVPQKLLDALGITNP